MNTNKLPNLGSTGWGKSLNDYIEGIETRVSDLEHGLSEARDPERVFNISSGVVGFGGKMKQGDDVLESGEELDDETSYFWEGDVFFKDTGDGSPLNVYMDEDTSFSLEDLGALEIGWNPVYLFLNDDGNVIYRVDSTNAYLTHPLVILLGFIFYDGSEKYWYYKTSRSEENTYEKRFMLTKPLAKFNSTFSVGVNGNRYAIIGKKVGTANPTLTLNAMGINYENSSISSEELVRGPDYKEFTVKEDTPIIWATTNSITFGTSDGFELSSDRSIHRVYFSNIGYYVIQSEKYSGNDDYSSVVSYGFQPMNTNLERYGDLVELFRFVTVGAEEEGDFINVYQAIGSGIPPVDSFGVVPEVNYISREGSNNIQFTDSNNNYFTLVGRNYGYSPKKVYFNFGSESEEEEYNVLFNDTLFDGNLGHISFRDAGGDTDYRFTPNNLSLTLSQNRYIKMGIASGFPGIELKNGNSVVSMDNNRLGLQNGESNIVLADNGNIDLSSQNINLNAVSVEIEAPSVEIESSDVEIASPNVNIASSSVDIESSDIKIRAKKDFWPEKLISSVQYVFDPREYGGCLLADRCMGAHRGFAPQLDDEAESSEMDINQALYKTEDDNWCLGLWAVEGKDVVSQWDSTYLVVITRSPGEEEYKFDFVRWVEYHATAEKADPFVFSVFPHDTASLTEAWGNEENDAFYQRNKITIKSESTTDIDSALSVSGNLEVGGNLEVDGDISTPSGLQIGSPNYKLVFLSGEVELKTEYTEISPNKYTVHWKNGTKKYLLNNFPVLGQRAFKAIVSLEQINGNIVDYETFWYGNFPLHVELGVGAYDVRVVEMTSSGVLLGLYESSSGDKLGQDEDRNVQVTIPKFTGWAWEVIS